MSLHDGASLNFGVKAIRLEPLSAIEIVAG